MSIDVIGVCLVTTSAFVRGHDVRRFLQIASAFSPSIRLGFPPLHDSGVRRCPGERLKICVERGDQRLVSGVRSRPKAQHRVRRRYRAISFNVSTDVNSAMPRLLKIRSSLAAAFEVVNLCCDGNGAYAFNFVSF
jgi:hypothetical protein